MQVATSPSSVADQQLLIRELSRRINNEYAAVMNMLERAAASTLNIDARSALEAAIHRLDGYARVHRALRMPWLGDRTDAAAYLSELCHSMSRSRLAQRKISLVFHKRTLWLSPEQCWFLGMIVYELVNNAARHAFGQTGGIIDVVVDHTADTVECRVSDNGTGRCDSRRGRGLDIVHDLASRLGGTFEQSRMSIGSFSRVIFRSHHDLAVPTGAHESAREQVS